MTQYRSLAAIAIWASGGLCSGANAVGSRGRGSFFPRGSARISDQALSAAAALSVRGGGDLGSRPFLDPTAIAKAATAAVGLNGAFLALVPSKAIDVYGGASDSPLLSWLVRATGGTMTMIALTGLCLFYLGTSVHTAAGIACLPWTINEIRTIVTGELDELGVPRSGIYLSLAISSLTALTLLTDAPPAGIVLKAFSIWQTVNGLYLSFAPGAAVKSWGVRGDGAVESGLRTIGHYNAAAGVLNGSLACSGGIDGKEAFGRAFVLPFALALSNVLASGDCKRFGSSRSPQYLWAMLTVAAVGILAFPVDR